jgi:hypothetical protein
LKADLIQKEKDKNEMRNKLESERMDMQHNYDQQLADRDLTIKCNQELKGNVYRAQRDSSADCG